MNDGAATPKMSREAMTQRLREEQERGWPRSTVGHWTEDMENYAPLDEIPPADNPDLAGLEPLPPDEQQLPEALVRRPELFDEIEDLPKAERRQLRSRDWLQRGET